MRRVSGKLFAMLLAAAMVFGLSGMTAFAAETDGDEPAAIAAESDSYNVKYAVTLWGINQDVDEEGRTLGLTFGPATGADYTNSYKAHLTKREYDAGGICLHWMSWEEVATQCRLDPTAFEACLENGCTHSVDITLNDTLLATSCAGQMDDGDGASVLRYSIGSDYRMWNSERDSNGGWPASQARAVLNGKDELTTGYAKYALDESECLFSCFPADLQNVIAAKAVRSDSSYKSKAEEDNVTSYDKLWLFSGKEVYLESGSTNDVVIRPLEGEIYQRSEILDVTTDSFGELANYNEEGKTGFWWLRTLPMNNDTQVFLVLGSGNISYYDCDQETVGLAPGFCLAGPADETEPDKGEPDKGGNGGGDVTTIEKINGVWTYTVNGVPDYTYTGFGTNDNGKWYVKDGCVQFDQNTVAKDTTGAIGTKGIWYYVVGSKVQENFTGLADYKNENGWWYIRNGTVDFTANTVAKNKNGWYYVTGGKVQFGFTGLANYKNDNGWWYIKGGKVDFTHNGVDKNKNGWWYVVGGKVQFNYSGVANYKNENGWWCIQNGSVNFGFTGIASNKNGMWYVKNGKVDFSFSGKVVTASGKTYVVTKGRAS